MELVSVAAVVGFSSQYYDRDFGWELVWGAGLLGGLHPLCCYDGGFCCFGGAAVGVRSCPLIGGVGGVGNVCKVVACNALVHVLSGRGPSLLLVA